MTWLANAFAELKGWQSLLGTVLGFGALVGGALYNWHLNRLRDDRLRREEAKTVALSLYGEINLLRGSLASMANAVGGWFVRTGHRVEDLPEHYRELFPLREPILYNALAPKIGLLEPDLLLLVTGFYSAYDAAKSHFPKLFADKARGVNYGVEWVLDPAIDALEKAALAVRRIEEIGRIAVPAEAPTLKQACEGLAVARDSHPDD